MCGGGVVMRWMAVGGGGWREEKERCERRSAGDLVSKVKIDGVLSECGV